MVPKLLCLCIRKLALGRDFVNQENALQFSLPPKLFEIIRQFREDVLKISWLLPIDSLPEGCFLIDPETLHFDIKMTAIASEFYLTKVKFFDVCAKLALDKQTERLYEQMTDFEHNIIEDMNCEPVVWSRALELSPRRVILHYDDIAYSCAESGYLLAFERNLLKIRELDSTFLQRCALVAILNGHIQIANSIRTENFSSAFHQFFPDGRPPTTFLVQLVVGNELRPEVGEQIFEELLDWLTKLDVQRLRREIANDKQIPLGVLQRLDSKYRECIDSRDYPCEYD
ncbi:hypothetical protein Mgra_00008528 [Meloidogyne graminicola]|uniref:Uncharacterized protein n=1 Tax=Meloidogyne graminicola TaxID=189291 RepID=A0A8S9ZFM9_9BILA|nr:hypothetical protein Mgra_00008528 [Meloidogyne graminicola]